MRKWGVVSIVIALVGVACGGGARAPKPASSVAVSSDDWGTLCDRSAARKAKCPNETAFFASREACAGQRECLETLMNPALIQAMSQCATGECAAECSMERLVSQLGVTDSEKAFDAACKKTAESCGSFDCSAIAGQARMLRSDLAGRLTACFEGKSCSHTVSCLMEASQKAMASLSECTNGPGRSTRVPADIK